MNRRKFFQFLATLPVVGALVPKESVAVVGELKGEFGSIHQWHMDELKPYTAEEEARIARQIEEKTAQLKQDIASAFK